MAGCLAPLQGSGTWQPCPTLLLALLVQGQGTSTHCSDGDMEAPGSWRLESLGKEEPSQSTQESRAFNLSLLLLLLSWKENPGAQGTVPCSNP